MEGGGADEDPYAERRDPFGYAIPRYSIELRCEEADLIGLGAGVHWLVLNASAFDLEKEAHYDTCCDAF